MACGFDLFGLPLWSCGFSRACGFGLVGLSPWSPLLLSLACGFGISACHLGPLVCSLCRSGLLLWPSVDPPLPPFAFMANEASKRRKVDGSSWSRAQLRNVGIILTNVAGRCIHNVANPNGLVRAMSMRDRLLVAITDCDKAAILQFYVRRALSQSIEKTCRSPAVRIF